MAIRRSVSERRAQKATLDREIKKGRRAVLIVNTRSRRGERTYSEAKRLLEESGMVLDAAYPVRYPERMVEIVREEIAKGNRFIIVGGGDGSISSVIGEFAFADVVFGLLPLGTANSFARTLGIPLDIAGAIDVLVNGKVADIDLAKVNDAYFANGSSIGMPAIVGRATPHTLKRLFGRGAYAFVAAGKFIRYTPFRCTVTFDGHKTAFEAFDVRIANGSFQGGVMVDSGTSPDDGLITIHILKGPTKWALAREWARLTLGAPFTPGDYEVLSASELTIDAMPKQHVAIDGEVITQTPIRISVAREALLLMGPRNFPQLEDQEQL